MWLSNCRWSCTGGNRTQLAIATEPGRRGMHLLWRSAARTRRGSASYSPPRCDFTTPGVYWSQVHSPLSTKNIQESAVMSSTQECLSLPCGSFDVGNWAVPKLTSFVARVTNRLNDHRSTQLGISLRREGTVLVGSTAGLQWHCNQSYPIVSTICSLVTHRLRLEKSLVNAERRGI